MTERVEALLDDCGAQYDISDDDYGSYYHLHWCDECGDYLSRISVKGECVTVEHAYLTPEQAVSEAVDGVAPKQATETVMRHGTCAECMHAHISADGRYCKSCDAFDRYFDGEWEPYFPSDFHCAHFERGGDSDRV